MRELAKTVEGLDQQTVFSYFNDLFYLPLRETVLLLPPPTHYLLIKDTVTDLFPGFPWAQHKICK